MTSEMAASSGVGRATDGAKTCFRSFIRIPKCRSASYKPALGELMQRRLQTQEDLKAETQKREKDSERDEPPLILRTRELKVE